MPFGPLLDKVAAQRRRLIVYAPDDTGADLADVMATRNLTVDHHRIPTLRADAFVVIRDNDQFYGAISLSDLLGFLTPPVSRPPDLDAVDAAARAVYELLDETVFVSLSRRQLLATSRELEDRAWRTGRGRLHVGFQRVPAFEAQADVYRDLARTTDIDVHVYLPPDASADLLGDAPVTVHTDVTDELGRYWFLLFDDGGSGSQNCALLARETGDRRYQGVWTYDPDLVAQAFAALESYVS